MLKVETCHVNPTSLQFKYCDDVCSLTAKLYNACIKYVVTTYRNNKSWKRVGNDNKDRFLFDPTHLYHEFKSNPLFKPVFNFNGKYKTFNTKVMKQVFHDIREVFMSYINALNAYKIRPGDFKAEPQLPHQHKKRSTATIPTEAYSIVKKEGFYNPALSNLYFKVTRLQLAGVTLKEAKIIPCTYGYIVNITYDDGLTAPETVPKQRISSICGIDIGITNLASCGFNLSHHNAFLLDGRKIKSINQRFNKLIDKLKSKLPNNVKTSKRIKKVTQKRNDRIKDYMHKASKLIVSYLVENKIKCLVIGDNKDWKQNTKGQLHAKTIQDFQYIPYYKFKEYLKYKCKEKGIYYIEREESYTSKTSFLDREPIQKQETYKGKRIKRGLFKSANGTKVNADLNGALNIIRKEFGDDYFSEGSLTRLFANSRRIKVLSDGFIT